MKYYNYLLFRIYQQMILNKTNDQKTITFLLTNLSTLVIYFTYYTIILYLNFYVIEIEKYILPNETLIILNIALIAFLNYVFFIKKKNFLNYNFKKDKKGGYIISIVFISIVFAFIFVANKNRDKINMEKAKLKQSEQIKVCDYLLVGALANTAVASASVPLVPATRWLGYDIK